MEESMSCDAVTLVAAGPGGRCSSAFQWEADKVIIRKGLRARERESRNQTGSGRDRNNRFRLNSLLSLILFELTANFACSRRPTPLSQKSPVLPTSNPRAQPVEPTPARRLDRPLQNEGQSWRREVGTPLSSSNHLWHMLLFLRCLCETVLAWREAVFFFLSKAQQSTFGRNV